MRRESHCKKKISEDQENATLSVITKPRTAAEGFVTCICSREETQAAPRRADDLGVSAGASYRVFLPRRGPAPFVSRRR